MTIKKRKNATIDIVLYGFRDLGSVFDAEEFFKILHRAGDKFIPKKISVCEPIRTLFSMDAAKTVWANSINSWGGGVIFNGRSTNEYYGAVDWNKQGTNTISIYLSTDLIKSREDIIALIRLVKLLFLWGNCVWGHGTHSSQGSVHYVPGTSYKDCLGGITWMSLFGPPYVKMFGKDILKSSPCHVEEFSENRFMLLTSEKPQEPTPEILEIQRSVKLHLGEDAFFRGKRAWEFTPEEVAENKHRPNTEGIRKPDFSGYLKETEPLNYERLIVEIDDDGSMLVRTE